MCNHLAAPFSYTLTASHRVFVIVGIVYRAAMAFRTLGGQFSARYPEGISAVAVYWHSTVALYAVVWIAVYVAK